MKARLHGHDRRVVLGGVAGELDSFDQAMEASLKLGDDEDESHGY